MARHPAGLFFSLKIPAGAGGAHCRAVPGAAGCLAYVV